MRKRVISSILTMALCLSLLPAPVFAQESATTDCQAAPEAIVCYPDGDSSVYCSEAPAPAQDNADAQSVRSFATSAAAKPAAPTDLRWETKTGICEDDGRRYQVFPGYISWTDKVNTITNYIIRIYNAAGEKVSETYWYFNSAEYASVYFHADVFLQKVTTGGTYTFSVQAIDGNNNFSAEVRSGKWTYKKPSSRLSAPTGIYLSGTTLRWNTAANADGYEVQCYQSSTPDGEKMFTSGICSRNPTFTEWNVSHMIKDQDMYCHFRVRSVSNDITKTCDSKFSSFVTLTPKSQGNGTSGAVSKLALSGMTPKNTGCARGTALTLTFNADVTAGSGNISVLKSGTDRLDYQVSVKDSSVSISGNTVAVAVPAEALAYGTDYYVTIDSGAFKSGSLLYYGLTDKTSWVFSTNSRVKEPAITLQWEKKGLLWWKENDKTKPPVPAGTDAQYAKLVCSWAQNCGVTGLTEAKVKKLLDSPMYLPVKDQNGSTVLLSDGETTVRQALSDIVFFENLQGYVQDLDDELRDIIKFDSTSKGKPIALWQETDAFEKVLGWYSQITKYMDRRNGDSNIFLSAYAPQACAELISGAGEYLKPLLKATLKQIQFENQLDSLKEYSKYPQLKQASKGIETGVKGSKAVYKAVSGDGVGGLLSFGPDLLSYFFSTTSNPTLNGISNAYETAGDVHSAVSVSLFLGSSIGLFPLVAEFYTKAMQRLEDTVCACYFIGDYYVCDKYPKLYDVVYDDATCLPEFNTLTVMTDASRDYGKTSTDPILYNWCMFLADGIEEKLRNDCVQLRYDLVNYILLLKYAGSLDADAAKAAMARYIKAESSGKAVTRLYVDCPVTVEIYDSATKGLVASLSANDETIQTCEYGTLYLLGDNKETKCFVLGSDAYYAKIVPYEAGTMDVTVMTTDAEGETSGTYYDDVALAEGDAFSTDLLESESLSKTGAQQETSEVITPTETVPVTEVRLSGQTELAVGATAQLSAEVLPAIATDQSVSWSSSAPEYLSVDGTGNVTAVSAGSATITATAGNVKTAEILINAYVPATEVTSSTESVTMLVGEEFDAAPVVTVLPEAHTHSLSWTSSDPGVAMPDENGLITAIGAGDAVITASADGLSASIYVSVSETPIDISLYQSDADEMRLKIDMKNFSVSDTFSANVYIVIYEGARMLRMETLAVTLLPGESGTSNIDLSGLAAGQTYRVSAMVLDGDMKPLQGKEEHILLG